MRIFKTGHSGTLKLQKLIMPSNVQNSTINSKDNLKTSDIEISLIDKRGRAITSFMRQLIREGKEVMIGHV